jgi:hypothetical protein
MHTRTLGPAAGWKWFMQAVNLGRNDPKALFGAGALLMLAALVPSIVQLVLERLFARGNLSASLMIAGLCALAMMVVYPLLIGGFFRVIDATEHDRPVQATALFDTFRAGQGRGRLIGYGLAMAGIYLLVFGVVFGVFGQEFAAWYMKVFELVQQATPGAPPPQMPPLPDGTGRVFGLSLLAFMFLGGAYAVGFGQVALGGRGVGGALADGFAGALRNVLPLLVLTVVGMAAMMLAALLLGLVMLVLGAIGGLVHPALGVLLIAPVYIAFLVIVYVVMFGIMYFAWRDICAVDEPVPSSPDRFIA